MGSECYSLGRKTADYKDQKFLLIRMKIGVGKGTGEARRGVRKWEKGEFGAVWRACQGGGMRIGRRWKDLDEEGGRQGPAPRGLAWPAADP